MSTRVNSKYMVKNKVKPAAGCGCGGPKAKVARSTASRSGSSSRSSGWSSCGGSSIGSSRSGSYSMSRTGSGSRSMSWSGSRSGSSSRSGSYSKSKARGCSNAAKNKRKGIPKSQFCGPSGGACEYTYPVDTKAHAIAALSYARHAPNPDGIRACVMRKARAKNWINNNGTISRK